MTIGKTEIKKEEYSIFNMDNKLKEICDDEEKLKYTHMDLVELIESYFFLDCVKGLPAFKLKRSRFNLRLEET